MASQWEELAKTIENIAPTISQALNGQDNKLASIAASLIQLKFGAIHPDDILKSIQEKDTISKISSIESEFGQLFQKQAYCNPTSDSLSQGINASPVALKGKMIIAYIILIIFFSAFTAVFVLSSINIELDIQKNGLLGLLTGSLISAFTAVVQYFFGSSASGNQKDAMLWTSSPPK